MQESLEEVDSVHQEELSLVLRQRDEMKQQLSRERQPAEPELIRENAALKAQLNELKDQSRPPSSAASNVSLTPPRERVLNQTDLFR